MASPSSPAKRSPSSTEAEELVGRALEAQGWAIVARNFRRPGSELDLVARKGRTVAIVEVKARRAMPRDFATARGLLPPAKVSALQRGAALAIVALGLEAETIRIDLAIVAAGRIAYHPAVV